MRRCVEPTYRRPRLPDPIVVVIHLILTPEAGKSEIPALLRGETPKSSTDIEDIGTKNYSKPPAVVILGAGYDDSQIAEMREACEGKSSIPWLRPDISKPAPPLGPAYGKALVDRIKVLLKELAEEGKLEGDAVYFY